MPWTIKNLAMPATLAAAVAVLAGCATYDETLVDASGRERRCEMTGWGGIGMRQAREGVAVCRETFNSLGFIARDRVGDLGIEAIRPAAGYLSIEQVKPASPAARHGIEPGDALLSVDGRRVNHVVEARRGLFGRAGESARVEVMQGDLARTVVLERETPQRIAAEGQQGEAGGVQADAAIGPASAEGQAASATAEQPAKGSGDTTPSSALTPASSEPLVIPGDPANSRP